jgi:uncharacterized protein
MCTTSPKNTTQHPIPTLTVRRLHVDLSRGFPRYWNGNDALRTAFANALSMSFPVGEQFFIDSVKGGLKHLPDTLENHDLREGIKKFIGQEATHRHLHGIYNAQLELQGYRNQWEPRLAKRIITERRRMERQGIENIYLHELAITCAVEHLTAIMGDITLSRLGQEGDWFLNAVEPMDTLWHWHAAEEAEHKSMAFDLYVRLGGNHSLRMYWYRRFLLLFVIDLTRQISNNLWRDGTWKYLSTWMSAVQFILGKKGLLRSTWSQLKDYGRQDFHPQQEGDDQMAKDWLSYNQVLWSAVS